MSDTPSTARSISPYAIDVPLTWKTRDLVAALVRDGMEEWDTGLEHGPQTYLAAVASLAAQLETSGLDRGRAISGAFYRLPYGPHVSESRWFVRRVLEAGDHAADLALLARSISYYGPRESAGRDCGCGWGDLCDAPPHGICAAVPYRNAVRYPLPSDNPVSR